jgi:transcriptional regulator with PAS, ATPase and Fis domain
MMSTFRIATNGHQPPPSIIGSSPALQRVLAAAAQLATSSVRVLITGETGVGKDLLARSIHCQSSRAHRRFVALNCAGLSETLLESELFGHVKGSFTGAYRDRVGCLEQAHHGTLFLDEIGEMSLRMQALLLRTLETGEIRPVGSDGAPLHVDVRVISATNRNLVEMIEKGTFREDLYYRINVAHLEVPPLRERVEDIEPIVKHLIAVNGSSLLLDEAVMRLFEKHRWPGNIRELQNVIGSLAGSVHGRPVVPEDLPRSMLGHSGRGPSSRERRRTVADELYEGLTNGTLRFWEDVYPAFNRRDLTRADLRTLIRRGLATSAGSYRRLLPVFRIDRQDYKRLLNFLAAHDCVVDHRTFSASSRPIDVAALSASGQARAAGQ